MVLGYTVSVPSVPQVGYFTCAQMADACAACGSGENRSEPWSERTVVLEEPSVTNADCLPRAVFDAAMWSRNHLNASDRMDARTFYTHIGNCTHHLRPPRGDRGCKALASGAHPPSEGQITTRANHSNRLRV
jgi:hypothetical protein